MDLQTAPSYFLAATGPSGFCSRFAGMYDPGDGWQCVILKGGPGSGKSTLMKKAAQRAMEAGQAVELIYCTSDPRSLDGVILPERKQCMMDGTAPHVMDPVLPGACERLFDPGDCWNRQLLAAHRSEIQALNRQIADCHRQAGQLRTAAASLLDYGRALVDPALNREKLAQYSRRLCRRLFPGATYPGGRVAHRFLSGITPDGWVTFGHTLTICARRVVQIEDDTGAVAGVILTAIRDAAAAHGEPVICCGDPLRPDEPDAVLLPRRQEAFARTDRFRRFDVVPERTIHARRFYDPSARSAVRTRLRPAQKQAAALIQAAVGELALARNLHDRLEAYYMAATDYGKLNAKSEQLLAEWMAEQDMMHKIPR
jgi:hypothetical protein